MNNPTAVYVLTLEAVVPFPIFFKKKRVILEPEYLVQFGARGKAMRRNWQAPQVWPSGNETPGADVMPTRRSNPVDQFASVLCKI
jgi:hypothetical protein